MTKSLRRFIAASWIAVSIGPFHGLTGLAVAADPGGAIAGVVTAPEGHPAAGWDVLLVSRDGDLVASAATTASGAYEFQGVPPGHYRLGVRDAAGRLGPVAGPGAEVASGVRMRQDVRLVAGSAARLAPAAYGARADSWWDRQTRNQKIFAVVGIVVGAAAVWAIVDAIIDDDDDEQPASPY